MAYLVATRFAEIIMEGIDLKRTFYYKDRWKIAE